MPIICREMTTQEAIEYYGGTQQKLADAIGITQASVSEWGEYPPPIRQLQLQQLSGGRLKAQPGLLLPKRKRHAKGRAE